MRLPQGQPYASLPGGGADLNLGQSVAALAAAERKAARKRIALVLGGALLVAAILASGTTATLIALRPGVEPDKFPIARPSASARRAILAPGTRRAIRAEPPFDRYTGLSLSRYTARRNAAGTAILGLTPLPPSRYPAANG